VSLDEGRRHLRTNLWKKGVKPAHADGKNYIIETEFSNKGYCRWNSDTSQIFASLKTVTGQA